MQFLKLDQAHIQPYRTQYRYSPTAACLGFTILTVITCGSLYAAYRSYREDATVGVIVCLWCAFWLGLFAKITLNTLRARLRESNWLVRLQSGGLLIKYRSYQNDHLPETDPVVAYIPFSEMAWARQHKLRRDLPDESSSNDETRFHTFAELHLTEASGAQELRDRLFAERQRMPKWQTRWYGRTRGLSRHYPVTLTQENILRLEWLVRPALPHFLSEIAPNVEVSEPSKTRVDYRHIGSLAKHDQENMLLELIEGGDTLGATRVIKKLYGYKTTAARRFLDELNSRNDK